jgi:hypothetical protein
MLFIVVFTWKSMVDSEVVWGLGSWCVFNAVGVLRNTHVSEALVYYQQQQ